MASVNEVAERIASALNVSPALLTITKDDSNRSPLLVYCRGSLRGQRFFAKIIRGDPYPIRPRYVAPWDDTASNIETRRPEDEVEAEWDFCQQLRTLAGPSFTPAPLGRSKAAKTIVWEEVEGIRVDQLLERSRLCDRAGNACRAALFQAGRCLRRLHDLTSRNGVIDIQTVIDSVTEVFARNGLCDSAHFKVVSRFLKQARKNVGSQGKLHVPTALNHGDFTLPNLIWNKNLHQLSVIDFEHFSYKPICTDLVTVISSLRCRLLNLFVPKEIILAAETAFWLGYGSAPEEVRILVNAVVVSRVVQQLFRTSRQRLPQRIVVLFYKKLLKSAALKRLLLTCPLLLYQSQCEFRDS
jgi:Ser/Thr protein kinase RdoA (MazF antagonist)